jgi:hypothetical protein
MDVRPIKCCGQTRYMSSTFNYCEQCGSRFPWVLRCECGWPYNLAHNAYSYCPICGKPLPSLAEREATVAANYEALNGIPNSSGPSPPPS